MANLKEIEKLITKTDKKRKLQMIRFSEKNGWELFNLNIIGVNNINGNYDLIYNEEKING